MKTRITAGFALIYTMLAGLFIIVLSAMMAAAHMARVNATASTTAQATANATQQGALMYAQRIIAARATQWVKSTEGASDPAAVLNLLQAAANAAFCNREAYTQSLRVHFTAQACGQPLSSALPPATRRASEYGNVNNWNVPYVIVTRDSTTGRESVDNGALRFTDGITPISVYGLWTRNATPLGSVATSGPAYVLGTATLTGTVPIPNVQVAGCAAPSDGCSATGGLTVNGTRKTAMTFSPNPVTPCESGGCATGIINAQAAVSTPIIPPLAPTLTFMGGSLQLGVTPDGQQIITNCVEDGFCTSTQLPATGDHVIVSYGDTAVIAEDPSLPAIAGRLTVYSSGNITVGGPLPVANPPCELDGCGPNRTMLGLISDDNITLYAPLTAALYARAGISSGDGNTYTLTGAAASGGPIENVVIRHDARMAAPSADAPPAWPTLSSRTNLVTVEPGELP